MWQYLLIYLNVALLTYIFECGNTLKYFDGNTRMIMFFFSLCLLDISHK